MINDFKEKTETHYEFWPPYVFRSPAIVVRICYIQAKHRPGIVDLYVVCGPIRLHGAIGHHLRAYVIGLPAGEKDKMISHHSSLDRGWADRGPCSWFLCSLWGNGERQQAVMALQSAPAAHTQITEVIILNQRGRKNLLTLKHPVQWAISPPFTRVFWPGLFSRTLTQWLVAIIWLIPQAFQG